MSRRASALKRGLVLTLSVFLLLISNVVPAGWMPASEPTGHFVVRICSEGMGEGQRARLQALAQGLLDDAMQGAGQQSGDDRQQSSDPCPYGVVATAFALPPSPPAVAVPPEIL